MGLSLVVQVTVVLFVAVTASFTVHLKQQEQLLSGRKAGWTTVITPWLLTSKPDIHDKYFASGYKWLFLSISTVYLIAQASLNSHTRPHRFFCSCADCIFRNKNLFGLPIKQFPPIRSWYTTYGIPWTVVASTSGVSAFVSLRISLVIHPYKVSAICVCVCVCGMVR